MLSTSKQKYCVEIDRRRCKNCGICAAFCPRQVFAASGGKVQVVSADRCSGCGFCSLHCPDYAVWVTKEEAQEETGAGERWSQCRKSA